MSTNFWIAPRTLLLIRSRLVLYILHQFSKVAYRVMPLDLYFNFGYYSINESMEFDMILYIIHVILKIYGLGLLCTMLQKCWQQYEPRSEKTGLRGFQPGPTQTGLYSHRRWLEA